MIDIYSPFRPLSLSYIPVRLEDLAAILPLHASNMVERPNHEWRNFENSSFAIFFHSFTLNPKLSNCGTASSRNRTVDPGNLRRDGEKINFLSIRLTLSIIDKKLHL